MTGHKQKQLTKLRSLLSNIEQLILKLQLIKLSEAAKLQHTSRQNLTYYIQNGTFKHEILFGQIYVYKIEVLKLKRSRPGPKTPAPLPRPISIRLPYQSFKILRNEDLRSFITRIRLAAVRETITVEGTVTRAAKRLHYGQTFFYRLYGQLETPQTSTTTSTIPKSKPIHLPTNLFVIKPNEGLRSFIDRIQLAVITRAIANETSTKKAADRLGYEYDSLITLFRKLKTKAKKP